MLHLRDAFRFATSLTGDSEIEGEKQRGHERKKKTSGLHGCPDGIVVLSSAKSNRSRERRRFNGRRRLLKATGVAKVLT